MHGNKKQQHKVLKKLTFLMTPQAAVFLSVIITVRLALHPCIVLHSCIILSFIFHHMYPENDVSHHVPYMPQLCLSLHFPRS